MCMRDEERKRDKSMFILYRNIYIKLRSNFKYVDTVYLTVRSKR